MSLTAPYLERRLVREVTGRKEAERLLEAKSLELYEKNLQLADYSKQLEEALEHMSAVMASAPDVIITCNRELVVENISDACREVLGYSPGELIGTKLDAIIPTLASDRASSPPPRGQADSPLMARRKSGETVEVELREKTTSIRNRALHVYVMQDVTARNKAQRLNDKISRQLHEARRLEAIGALASGIAHEINTPIQFIGDNVAFVKTALSDIRASFLNYEELRGACARDGAYGAEVRKVDAFNSSIDLATLVPELATAMTETAEGLAFVRDIVLLVRHFAHPGTGKAEEANVNTIVRNVLTISRNRWKNVVAIETVLADGLPKIDCHPGQLQQVLINLLINAIEAIEDVPQDDGAIQIATEAEESIIRIRVSDNGPGVPPSLREKIFDPFFTTKKLGKGTGQGLALAKDIIVNQHRGRFYLHDTKGFSTSFVIELPTRALAQDEPAAGATP